MGYFEELSAPIEVRTLDHNGFSYIAASDVRERLNKVFDCNWNFLVSEYSIMENTVVVQGRLEATLEGTTVVKESFGTGEIKRFNRGSNEGKPVDLGNAFQTAVADALKSCAKMLGIGNRIGDSNNTKQDKGTLKNESELKHKLNEFKNSKKSNKVDKPLESDDNSSTKDTGNADKVKSMIAGLRSKSKPKIVDRDTSNESKKKKKFGTDNSKAETVTGSHLLILENFASNVGMTVEELITNALGDGIKYEDVTPEQVAIIINKGADSFIKGE